MTLVMLFGNLNVTRNNNQRMLLQLSTKANSCFSFSLTHFVIINLHFTFTVYSLVLTLIFEDYWLGWLAKEKE